MMLISVTNISSLSKSLLRKALLISQFYAIVETFIFVPHQYAPSIKQVKNVHKRYEMKLLKLGYVDYSKSRKNIHKYVLQIDSRHHLNFDRQMNMMKPIDDDEISQHEFMMMKNSTMDETMEENPIPQQKKGYQRIEDWHEEEISQNSNGKEVLVRLKQEKSFWSSKFESFGGEGI